MSAPRNLSEAKAFRYNVWGGNPNGNAYQPDRCAYEVTASGRGTMFYQCLRKPGNGPRKLYCKQHAKMVKP